MTEDNWTDCERRKRLKRDRTETEVGGVGGGCWAGRGGGGGEEGSEGQVSYFPVNSGALNEKRTV